MRRALTAAMAALALAGQPAAAWAAAPRWSAQAVAADSRAAAVATGAVPSWSTMVHGQFIRSLYSDVVARWAVPNEVQTWVDELVGGRSRFSVAGGFVLSAESLELIVRRNAAAILGRQPRPDELTTWSGWARDSRSATVLQMRLLGLAEAHASITREAWITRAYRILQGGDPTPDEIATRTAQLSSGQLYSAVARAISDTPRARLWRFNALFQRLLGRDSTRWEQTWYAGQTVFADLSYTQSILAYDAYLLAGQRWMFTCYARNLYLDVLGRTGEQSAVRDYADSLVKGASAQTVATLFVHSPENVEKVIRGAFTRVLGRSPTSTELWEYRARMSDRFGEEHWSRTRVLVRLMLTTEFLGRYSGRAWIQQAYGILLGRAASEAEIDGWAPALAAGGYTAIAEGIASSEETRHVIVANAYRTMLGRAPDPAGLDAWTARLGQAPSNLAENEEFVAYAQEIGGQVLVAKLVSIAAHALGVGLITDALSALAIPDIPVKADRLARLARHPLHDMDLTLKLAASDEYRALTAWDPDRPTTKATKAGTAGRAAWFRSPVTVTLDAKDPQGTCCSAGVAGTQYRLDVSPWLAYTSPFRVTKEGRTVVSFRSHDLAGNSEAVRTAEVRIDTAAPVITGAPTSLPNGDGWYRTDVAVQFVASDATSGIDWATRVRTLTTEGADQSVIGRAKDVAGNTSTYRVGGISIDRTGPAIIISSPSAAPYANTDPMVVGWSVTDALSGVARQSGALDGAAVASGQAVSLMLMTPTEHIVAVRALDRAGNTAWRSVTFTVTVDAAGMAAVVRELRETGGITSDGAAAALQALVSRFADAREAGDVTRAHAVLDTLLRLVDARECHGVTAAAAGLLRDDIEFLEQHLS